MDMSGRGRPGGRGVAPDERRPLRLATLAALRSLCPLARARRRRALCSRREQLQPTAPKGGRRWRPVAPAPHGAGVGATG